jgi:type IV pilus assembly protein PilP
MGLYLCLLLLLLFQPGGAEADEIEPAGPEEATTLKVDEDIYELLDIEQDDFVYQREGRTDPFVPFVPFAAEPAVAAKVAPKPEEPAPEVLTGLRKFEPGQLSVVAIIETPRARHAMVEDSVRKGYVIRKGTKIGRTGVVEDIEPNRVLIKQYSYTLAGDKRYQTVVMELKKEGEKSQ